MVPGPGGDDLVHKGGAIPETDDFEVPRSAMLVEQFHEDLEIGLRLILISGGVHHQGRAVVGIQQGLDVQAGEQLFGTRLVQFPVRINEENGRKVVRIIRI